MDAAIITAVGGILIACGGGAWKLIDRADKKRERREAAVEELLKARVASLEAQLQKQATDFEKERRRSKRYNSRVKAAAGKWREQLLMHDIQPDPAEWPTEDEHDDTE
ncbi:hypothetical protein [Paenarthrobacter ureafaciens]|uniref:hypothetical protein n=1 Tax=Paenarthrobacter ureafaciens TaxID=37931 RepID=UPI001FB4A4DD|nr:hypothetical protein [Paenarthrobacter ureafaciens]UOD80364.1 hypothetical protein MQZ73_14745 [Paenarthrobacter ureafaciens]WNZ03017.1 hypothetical protein PVT25_15385 [Paenarthrobacter ureafaciens]